jgi:hypothetical protein
MIDCSIMLEGSHDSRFRTLRGIKNRFGAVNELGVFAMTEQGMKEVSNPSAIFLQRGEQVSSGSVVMVMWEGTRPLLVEIQALVDDSHLGNPRRVAVGLDQNRLSMLLAVLHRHGGIMVGDQDVFVNVVGGVRAGEPSLYVNFQENPAQIARTLSAFDLDLDELRRQGLHLLYVSPVELQIDSIIVEIFRLIRDRGVRRVVIDAVGDLAKAARNQQRLYDFLYSLMQHLAARNTTTLLTYETASVLTPNLAGEEGKLSSMSDTILLLSVELEREMRRTIRVLKSRGTAHDLQARELEITGHGIRIAE